MAFYLSGLAENPGLLDNIRVPNRCPLCRGPLFWANKICEDCICEAVGELIEAHPCPGVDFVDMVKIP